MRRVLRDLLFASVAVCITLSVVGLAPLAVTAQSSHESSGSVSPAAEAFEVTPSDVTEFSPPCRSLFVGTAGDVAVDMSRTGSGVTYVVAASVVVPIRVSKVLATGTTASDIVCLY